MLVVWGKDGNYMTNIYVITGVLKKILCKYCFFNEFYSLYW